MPAPFDKLKSIFEGQQGAWLSCLIASTGLLTYSLINLYGFLHQETPITTALPPSSSQHKNTHSTEINYPLFGNYIPNGHDKNTIPKTLLNLKLTGVLKASKKGLSQVTIKVGDGKEKNYTVGDTLPSGAKIIRIFDDSALLLRNGQVERLILPVPHLPLFRKPKPLEFEP